MSTLVVFLLLVADGGPPIGAFTDSAACTRSATKMTADMQAKDPHYNGKTLYVCQPLDVTRFNGEPALKWQRQL
jgi:hypothetical protein